MKKIASVLGIFVFIGCFPFLYATPLSEESSRPWSFGRRLLKKQAPAPSVLSLPLEELNSIFEEDQPIP